MISCVILAAGESRRFGSPKALARINQKTVLEHLIDEASGAEIKDIVVVLGAHASEIKPFLLKHKSVKVVYNKDYNLGQTSSFKAGLASVFDDTDGILLLPVDFPMIERSVLVRLSNEFIQTRPKLLIPAYHGRKGHPPIFSMELKKIFMGLDNNKGINTVAQQCSSDVRILNVDDPAVVQSFNTREEFEAIKFRV